MQDAKHDNPNPPTCEHSQPLVQNPSTSPQQSYTGQQPHPQQQQPYPPQPYPVQPPPPSTHVQQQLSEGEAYLAGLVLPCAQGNHTPKTRYGMVGIITAITSKGSASVVVSPLPEPKTVYPSP
ncbi:hypothetical protein E1B28_006197 [Marasmius oreades]|uniref:Uncharacterized protein n=1 Tax=Marasmius oreades TaxID=181124 RepID=A0A9P7S4S0_9AGAR|nr:uncharacterized protein E1B28_006197 [Marasmius oreades]KAG7095454.1 hypothetical protein E1B28_006197 [Marasmius oreades]